MVGRLERWKSERGLWISGYSFPKYPLASCCLFCVTTLGDSGCSRIRFADHIATLQAERKKFADWIRDNGSAEKQ